MEAELMHTTVARDSALTDVLASFRGSIIDARLAYPEVLHLDVRDDKGELWQFATQDASWLPSDPAEMRYKSIVRAEIDWSTGKLNCELSDGATLMVTPAPQEEPDDPPNWELFTPNGLLLEFGPGEHWRLGDADELDRHP
ncbi:MAG TPA: hypothetical protein VFQ14_01580 [Thermoleophilaceae bacterium]|nr:hypothetical protein [Thermoleophilaceae bacterium]